MFTLQWQIQETKNLETKEQTAMVKPAGKPPKTLLEGGL